MKQHAIPQNILDIEFKLFSKFTIKEFIYIALGIAIGSIFLYSYSNNVIPGIIAIPLFLLFAGLGLFFGLAEINDQKADAYVGNYYKAITNPTMRVWKNKRFDAKYEEMKPQTSLNITTGGKPNPTMISGTQGNQISNPVKEITNEFENSIDSQEQARLQQISQTNRIPIPVSPTPQPLQSPQPQLQTFTPNLQDTGTKMPNQQANSLQQVSTSKTPLKKIKLTIGSHNASKLKTLIRDIQPTPNNINLRITGKDGTPIPKLLTTFKDGKANLIQALMSNTEGCVITNKSYPNGSYFVNIQSDNYVFPELEFVLDGNVIEPIKIIPLN